MVSVNYLQANDEFRNLTRIHEQDFVGKKASIICSTCGVRYCKKCGRLAWAKSQIGYVANIIGWYIDHYSICGSYKIHRIRLYVINLKYLQQMLKGETLSKYDFYAQSSSSSSDTPPIFILCDLCYWCATYFDKTIIPVDNICP